MSHKARCKRARADDVQAASSLRNYGAGLVCGLMLALLAYVGTLAILAGHGETYTTVHIGSWYARKAETFAVTPSPRVVFVGGSNVLYGIDAEAFQRITGVPAINAGTHAALATAYLFDWVKRRLRNGDLVVLALEYHSFENAAPTSIHANYLANRDLMATWRLPLRVGAFALLAVDWDQLLLETRRNLTPSWKNAIQQHIQEIVASTIGPQGDYRTHTYPSRGAREQGLMDSARPELPLTALRAVDPAIIADLTVLKTWCDQRGIGLVAVPPSTMDFPDYHTEPGRVGQAQYVDVYRSVGIPLLQVPADEFRPREEFFDSIYHLSYEGMQAHTGRLVQLLSGHLPDRLAVQSGHR